jgi:hypothetical protein
MVVDHDEILVYTHMSKIACHDVASSKIRERLASTFLGSVPTSATLTENRGLRRAIEIVSAVEVLPTPGGPKSDKFE